MNRKPEEVPASLKNVDVKSLLRSRGVYLKQDENKRLKALAKPIAAAMLKKKNAPVVEEKRRHSQFTNDVVMAYWTKQIHIVDTLEKQFEEKLKQYIGRIEKDFLHNLEQEVEGKKSDKPTKKSIEVLKGFFDDSEDEYLAKAQFDFTPLLESVATLAGNEAVKLTGADMVYVPFAYRDKIRQNVERFAKSLFDTDKDHLTNLLFNSLEEGKSVPEIRTLIESEFPEYTKMQAQRITRTEVLRASNQSAIDAYTQSGVVEGKQWLTAGAVDECEQYEGQIESLSSNFYSGGNEFQDGDPPLHPNCRCVVLPILIDNNQ